MGLAKKVGMAILPAKDLDAALTFYREALGLEEKFRDGDRFAALDLGGTTVALAAGEEDRAGVAALSFKVDDVRDAVVQLRGAGAEVLRDVEEGPHEFRAVLRDPAGNPFIVYSAKARPA